MVNEDDRQPVKKPVPLPRKSLCKNKSVSSKEDTEEVEDDGVATQKKTEGKYFNRDDWKSVSGSFVFEKSRLMKNEVQKLEKSVKSIISKRRSVQSKSQSNSVTSEHGRSDSLPDDSIFFKISFDSPLSDEAKQETSLSNDSEFYERDLSPPPYPPPDLPDESVYDKMRSFGLSDQCSCKSTSSDSTSIYDELSVYQSVSNSSDFLKETEPEKDFSQASNEEKKNRYETLTRNTSSDRYYRSLTDIPESDNVDLSFTNLDLDKEQEKRQNSNIKYIIHLFDPLEDSNEETAQADLNLSSCTLNDENVIKDKLFDVKEFDLFNSGVFPLDNKKDEISSLDLKEGHYGKIRKIKSSEPSKVVSSNERYSAEPPPIPPRRTELPSLKFGESTSDKWKESGGQKQAPKDKSENVEERAKPSDIIQWSSLKRVAKIVANNIENRASYLSMPGKKSGKQSSDESLVQSSYDNKLCVSEVSTLPQNFPKHSGIIFRPGGIQRWGVLSQRKLTLFANKDSPDVKETVPMDSVLSVQVSQNKIGAETVGVHCFEISISPRNQPLLIGVPSVSERHIWMRKLLESVGPAFPPKLSMDYTKAGWCFAKEGISCNWTKCCILLHHRTLHLSAENGTLITADLRKARKITLQTEGFPCEEVTEKGPLMVVDLQGKTLYLQMDYERETKAWEVAVMSAALKNGPTLCEQQLTKDDVPAIVDKCLNFVHTHGTFSEGIYRRNGSNRTVSHLLASLRCNAWSVQLSKENCSEFDVSSVLKRYFRDLPEPLLVPEIHADLENILEITSIEEKIEKYKMALKKLPVINYLTARRLMGHLYFIDKEKEKNLMGADNLAAIWGPTLLQVQEQVSLTSNCFKVEALVINDLIAYYPEIFDVAKEEVERETKILEMLESYHNNSNTLNKKPSGELKIWVYLHSVKNVDGCINVSINPQKTSEEVCKELSYKTNDPVHLLCLEEVVCSGNMTRPLNHSEKVLDTVLRWGYWDEADRKDNCLVLTKNNLFREVVQSTKYPLIVCEELKFADQKSKSFKSYHFEFSQAKLICYKDKACTQKIGEWKIEDIVWYLGHEPKRVPQGRWSITFIEKQCIGPRTKEKPYFGNTISGTSEEQKFRLISAMLMAQYAKDILPTPNFLE